MCVQFHFAAPSGRSESFMSIKLCQHVRENGVFCRSAALRGRRYCYFHTRVLGRRMAMAQARAKGERWRLNLPPLEDMHAVQSALMHVLEAVADDRIDPRRAGLLLYGLQQASGNIKGIQDWIGRSRYDVDHDDELRVTDYPGFEQEFGLPKRLDLNLAPEQAFPPPVDPPSVEEKLQRAYYEAIVRAGTHDLRTPVSPDPTAPKTTALEPDGRAGLQATDPNPGGRAGLQATDPNPGGRAGLQAADPNPGGRAGLQAGVHGHANDAGFSPGQNDAGTPAASNKDTAAQNLLNGKQASYQGTASAVPAAAKNKTGASAPASVLRVRPSVGLTWDTTAAPNLRPMPSSLQRRVSPTSSHTKRASARSTQPFKKAPYSAEPQLPTSWMKQAMKVIQQ
jgi:hypothetical protein